MKKEWLTLDKIDKNGKYEDYWFKTNKEANEYLTEKYMEQGMRDVFRVVFSKTDEQIGIERTFVFNHDVISPEDEELKSILKELALEIEE